MTRQRHSPAALSSPGENFRSAEMEERSTLYLKLAERIWNPERLMEVATA